MEVDKRIHGDAVCKVIMDGRVFKVWEPVTSILKITKSTLDLRATLDAFTQAIWSVWESGVARF